MHEREIEDFRRWWQTRAVWERRLSASWDFATSDLSWCENLGWQKLLSLEGLSCGGVLDFGKLVFAPFRCHCLAELQSNCGIGVSIRELNLAIVYLSFSIRILIPRPKKKTNQFNQINSTGN